MAPSVSIEAFELGDAEKSNEFYSSIGSNYEAAFGHDEGLITFLQKLLTHLPQHAEVLDVGCGCGNPVAKTLAAAEHRVTGIDISDEMVRLSRKAVPSGNFSVGDMRTYVPKTKMDAILTILSLFTLTREEIEAQVAKWSKTLKPGGLLSICSITAEDVDLESKSNGLDSDGQCARDISSWFMGAETLITLFTKEGWKELLWENGLEIVDTHRELFVPPASAQCDEEMHYFIIAKKVQ